MKTCLTRWAAVLAMATMAGCGTGTGTGDGGDVTADAIGNDVRSDAVSPEGGRDAQPDTPGDVRVDVGADVADDVQGDAMEDAASDVPGDAPADVPTDTAPSCMDMDGDGYGVGPGCMGPDCNDMISAVHPGATETCNGSDDDCDGMVDETFTDLGMACSAGVGACMRSGMRVCAMDGSGTVCNAMAGPPSTETCNGIDDDCDGMVDETFTDLGMACSAGIGACMRSGMRVCAMDGSGTVCNAMAGPPSTETCNGIDDDCDSMVDETFTDLGMACTVGVGACERTGMRVCSMDGSGTQCSVTPGSPSMETCNGIDDDCDNVIDNGSVCGACTDDTLEPNDTRATARALMLPYGPSNLQICFRNPDFYALGMIAAGQTIVAQVTFDGSASDIDIELLGPTGSRVAASTGVGNSEQIRYDVASAGEYTLRVYSANNRSAPYRLSVYTQATSSMCMNDVYEINDTVAASFPATRGTTYSGEICVGDQDFYQYSLPGSAVVRVQETSMYASGRDIDIEWLRYGQSIASSTGTMNDERIVSVVPMGGDYQLRVYGYMASTNSYTASVSDVAFNCTALGLSDVDDMPTSNDTAATARLLSAGTPIIGRACGNDDWYNLGAQTPGQTLEIDLYFRHARGDVDMRLYQGSTQVASSAGSSDGERIVYTIPSSGTGTYTLRVYGYGTTPAQNEYRLGWTSRPSTGGCPDDRYEPNQSGTQPSSFPLDPGDTTSYRDGVVCSGNDDYFDLGPIGPGHTITLNVLFTHSSGDIDVELFREGTSTAVATAYGVMDNERITYTVPAGSGGRYYARVYLASGSRNTYSINYTVTRP